MKDKLIKDLIDNAEKNNEKFYDYITTGTGIKEIDELSNLRKQTVGRAISKDERINFEDDKHNECWWRNLEYFCNYFKIPYYEDE